MCKWYLNDPQAIMLCWWHENRKYFYKFTLFCRNQIPWGLVNFYWQYVQRRRMLTEFNIVVEWSWLRSSYVKYQFFPYSCGFLTHNPTFSASHVPHISPCWPCSDQDPGVGEMKGEKLLQIMRPSSVSTRRVSSQHSTYFHMEQMEKCSDIEYYAQSMLTCNRSWTDHILTDNYW